MKYEMRALNQDGQVLARAGLRALPERLVRKLMRGWASAAFDKMASIETVMAVCPEQRRVVGTITRTTDMVHRAAGTRAITAQVDGRLYTRADLDLLAAEMAGLHAPGSAYDWMVHAGKDGAQLVVALHDDCSLELQPLGE